MTKKKRQPIKKKKVYLYSFTLGKSYRDCMADEGIIHSELYKSKNEAKSWMRQFMKHGKWPYGSVIKITIEKVR